MPCTSKGSTLCDKDATAPVSRQSSSKTRRQQPAYTCTATPPPCRPQCSAAATFSIAGPSCSAAFGIAVGDRICIVHVHGGGVQTHWGALRIKWCCVAASTKPGACQARGTLCVRSQHAIKGTHRADGYCRWDAVTLACALEVDLADQCTDADNVGHTCR